MHSIRLTIDSVVTNDYSDGKCNVDNHSDKEIIYRDRRSYLTFVIRMEVIQLIRDKKNSIVTNIWYLILKIRYIPP